MIIPMAMPQVSVTSSEVKLVCWLKKPGDPVRRGEPVVEVETDKATIAVESYVDGYFRIANYPDGATVPLEAVIAILTTTPDEPIDGEPIAMAAAQGHSSGAVSGVDQPQTPMMLKASRIDVTPVARKLAADNRIDLATLQGTGPAGRIIRADVEAALEARDSAGVRRGETVALSALSAGSLSIRKAIAQRTALSKASIPHYYVSMDIDMQAALQLIADLKKIAASRNVAAPTLTDLLIWICGRLLPEYPLLHGSWSEERPLVNPEINIGMVVGLDEGLIVPVVHDADRISLSALTQTTRLLKQKATHGGLSDRDLAGSTFTISNLGMWGVNSFIAVINPPESAILALGAATKRAVVNASDEVIVRPIMTATLSVDHRMIDGIAAAKFLNALKEKLESPSSLLFDL